jgi:hypothetical protein
MIDSDFEDYLSDIDNSPLDFPFCNFIYIGDFMTEINPKWDAYILWLATPLHERGTVATEEDWAKSNGFADARTMRRWKKNPLFLERQKTLTQTLTAKVGGVVVFEDDEVAIDSDERDYKLVKQKLVESAKGGSLKAQELYMKTYGKTWVEDEVSARQTDYSNIELSQLIGKAITVLGEEQIINSLVEKGYKVLKDE